MAENTILLVTNLKREQGKLYFCGTDKATGMITVCSGTKGNGRKKK